MKISTGMAEITLPRNSGDIKAHNKAYVWPKYNEGNVTPVQKITRRTAGDIPYMKATPEEHNRIMEEYRAKSFENYSSRGNVQTQSPSVEPGSLFEALV